MGDFIGQVVLLTKHAERKRNSYFRFETGKDKIQYQIGTTRHRNTRSSQLVPIIILENHICDKYKKKQRKFNITPFGEIFYQLTYLDKI